MDLSPDTIRARFHALTEQSLALQAELDPRRDELARLVAGDSDLSLRAAMDREAELRADIVAKNDALYPIEQERALCSRALGGKTGMPDDGEPAADAGADAS